MGASIRVVSDDGTGHPNGLDTVLARVIEWKLIICS